MPIIVAIGGGELGSSETLGIDMEIVNLTGNKNPNVLFIPTASHDAPGYCESFKSIYGDQLGCKVDALLLTENIISHDRMEQMITNAALIYVGGGDTAYMLKVWKDRKVDQLLINAYNKGTILSGISAGSICWFEYGHDDSAEALEALGILKGIHSPHINEQHKELEFTAILNGIGRVGIGIDNHCAVIFKDDQYKVISTRGDANAYILVDHHGETLKKGLTKDGTYRSLKEIYGQEGA